jgi:hypothetical protein
MPEQSVPTRSGRFLVKSMCVSIYFQPENNRPSKMKPGKSDIFKKYYKQILKIFSDPWQRKMSVLKNAAKIFPDEILRKIVSYVPGKISIHKTGWKEMIRRLRHDADFRSKLNTVKPYLYCSFRHGKNRLKTPATMTYEDPWYGACHMMILTVANEKDALEFRVCQWVLAVLGNGIVYEKLVKNKLFFKFRDRKEKTIHLEN